MFFFLCEGIIMIFVTPTPFQTVRRKEKWIWIEWQGQTTLSGYQSPVGEQNGPQEGGLVSQSLDTAGVSRPLLQQLTPSTTMGKGCVAFVDSPPLILSTNMPSLVNMYTQRYSCCTGRGLTSRRLSYHCQLYLLAFNYSQ